MSAESEEDSGAWRSIRENVLKRDGYECRFCGITDSKHRDLHDSGLHAHHIVPRSDGGGDNLNNLISVCAGCHRTLEETHAKAVGELKQSESYRQELENVQATTRATYAGVDDIVDELIRFLDDHPLFEREIGVLREGGLLPRAGGLETGATPEGCIDVDSEWQFAAGWGYKEGVMDTLNRFQNEVDFRVLNDGE